MRRRVHLGSPVFTRVRLSVVGFIRVRLGSFNRDSRYQSGSTQSRVGVVLLIRVHLGSLWRA